MGHGHVIPNPDGSRARCGGPGLCAECSRELAQKGAATVTSTVGMAVTRCDLTILQVAGAGIAEIVLRPRAYRALERELLESGARLTPGEAVGDGVMKFYTPSGVMTVRREVENPSASTKLKGITP